MKRIKRKISSVLVASIVLFVIFQSYLNATGKYDLRKTHSIHSLKPITYFRINDKRLLEKNVYSEKSFDLNNTSNQEEWENILNKFIFIRRASVVYSENDSLVSMLLLANESQVADIGSVVFDLSAKSKLNQAFNYSRTIQLNSKTIKRLLSFNIKYSTYRLDYLFNIKKYLKRNMSSFGDIQIKLKSFFFNNLELFHLKDSINVKILKYTRSDSQDDSSKLKVALCTKMYNLTLDHYDDFKLWIQLNNLIGYDKIIIYNNSIPHEKFSSLFELYSDFVEVKPYRTIPAIDNSFNNQTKTKYHENMTVLSKEELFLNERLVINECFLENRLTYDFISVLDYDELLVPQIDGNIKDYLLFLQRKYQRNTGFSFWFRYVTFIDNEFIKNNFDAIAHNYTNSSQIIKFYYEKQKKIEFQVNSFSHLNYLVDSIENIHENSSSLFNRIFMIREKRRYEFDFGKSVHRTIKPFYVGHHETMQPNLNSIKIDYEDGYISHFRKTLKNLNGRFNLTNLNFDKNYMKNYLFKFLIKS